MRQADTQFTVVTRDSRTYQGKGLTNMRIERYYNALIGRSRPGVAPTIQEARKDLHRALETQFPFYGG